MADADEVLPPNRTELEAALEKLARRATETTTPLHRLWDAERCPLHLLPWLAWALGVDEWSSEWPEERKRAVVATALQVRRRAGTTGAVRTAVEALDIEGIEYSEWHEYGGDPGTYRITATLEERGMSQEQYDELVRVIDRASRLSAHLDPVGFEVVGRGFYQAASATQHGQVTTVRPHLTTEVVQRHGARAGSALRGVATVDLRPALVAEVTQAHAGRSGWGLQAVSWTAVYPA